MQAPNSKAASGQSGRTGQQDDSSSSSSDSSEEDEGSSGAASGQSGRTGQQDDRSHPGHAGGSKNGDSKTNQRNEPQHRGEKPTSKPLQLSMEPFRFHLETPLKNLGAQTYAKKHQELLSKENGENLLSELRHHGLTTKAQELKCANGDDCMVRYICTDSNEIGLGCLCCTDYRGANRERGNNRHKGNKKPECTVKLLCLVCSLYWDVLRRDLTGYEIAKKYNFGDSLHPCCRRCYHYKKDNCFQIVNAALWNAMHIFCVKLPKGVSGDKEMEEIMACTDLMKMLYIATDCPKDVRIFNLGQFRREIEPMVTILQQLPFAEGACQLIKENLSKYFDGCIPNHFWKVMLYYSAFLHYWISKNPDRLWYGVGKQLPMDQVTAEMIQKAAQKNANEAKKTTVPHQSCIYAYLLASKPEDGTTPPTNEAVGGNDEIINYMREKAVSQGSDAHDIKYLKRKLDDAFSDHDIEKQRECEKELAEKKDDIKKKTGQRVFLNKIVNDFSQKMQRVCQTPHEWLDTAITCFSKLIGAFNMNAPSIEQRANTGSSTQISQEEGLSLEERFRILLQKEREKNNQ